MKVLMFGWEFPPHISGGLGTACYGLTKGLTSFNDIDLTFIVPKAYGDEQKQNMKLIGANEIELSDEVIKKQKIFEKSKRFKFDKRISAYISPEQYEKLYLEAKQKELTSGESNSPARLEFNGDYGVSLFEEISRYKIVAAELAKKESFDVVHAHDWLTYPAGIEAKKISGKPLVVHVHATEFDRSSKGQNEKVLQIERKGMMAADKVITVSEFTRRIVVEKYQISPSKVIAIHNAVEPIDNKYTNNIWKKNYNDHLVTFLGRITSQKGPEYFIDAAYKVIQRMDNVRFVMAGSGDLMEKMVRYAARLRITDHFHFTGFLKGEDVFKMYHLSDLYVMPSVSEPFGISPLEAMQSNVPVIISKQSGVSEVLKNAIKVDFWDIDAMADAIYGVLNYRSLANHLSGNGKKEVHNLQWTRVASKIKELYYQVVYNHAS